MDMHAGSPEMHQQLRKFADEWQKVFDNVEDPVFVMDRFAHVVWGNRRFLQKIKMDEDSCVGRKCHDLVQHEHCSSQGCPLKQFMQDGRVHTVEVVGDNGESLLVMILPVFDAADGIVGAVHLTKDISSYKDTREFSCLIQMVRDVAHGINNGLSIINSNVDVLKEYGDIFLSRNDLLARLQETVRDKAWIDAQEIVRKIDAFDRQVNFQLIMLDLMPLVAQTREGGRQIQKAMHGLRFFLSQGVTSQVCQEPA